MAIHRQRLGDFLIMKGALSPEQLEHALALQKVTGRRLGQVLVDLGLLKPEELLQVLSEQLGVRYWDLEAQPPDPAAARLISDRLARRFHLIPVLRDGERLIVAMAEPTNVEAQDEVAMLTGMDVEPVLAREEDILLAISRVFGVMESVEEAVRRSGGGGRAAGSAAGLQPQAARPGAPLPWGEGPPAPGLPLQVPPRGERPGPAGNGHAAEMDLSQEAPIIRLVDGILSQAVREGATDIHLEPQEDRLRIRFRVDGFLREATSAPAALQQAIAARIKVMAGLNISERRLPQDGRFSISVDGREWDVRVATMPTFLGEKVALRLLNKESGVLGLGELGLDPQALERLKQLLKNPHGMILVTGPTGSGKSTTLAAALRFLNSDQRNIVTVEDPIEHRVPGVNQTQVNPRAGLTFGIALRHLLRQDPDVVMVGEIRDAETAEIAIKAALTGHLVLSTLHTNSAAAALVRLTDMGVEPYLVASAVSGILGQRLIRLLCSECRDPFLPGPDVAAALGLTEETEARLYRARGCRTCRNTGYRGRSAIFELLVMDEPIRRLAQARADAETIEKAAVAAGMATLLQAGRARVLAGETSVDELLRVVGGREEGGSGWQPTRTGHGAA